MPNTKQYEELMAAVEILLSKKLSKQLTKYFDATVVAVDTVTSKYQVTDGNSTYNVPARFANTLSVDDIVVVCIPNGDRKNMFIDHKRDFSEKLSSDSSGSYTEVDPTVPSWAKQATKPTYTASEVGVSELTNAEIEALLSS